MKEPNDVALEELEAGQVERLTVRLHGLIRNYPKGPGLLKEFIQNADDAAASHVRIILDRRTHPSDRVSAKEEKLWAGPALLICNDSIFREADFTAIQRIGESSKFETALKTGRFGHGFNVAYNVTDYPSFVSADRIIFFDPHRHHPRAKKEMPGFGFRLTTELWKRVSDLLSFYTAGGLTSGTTSYEGTIFRLPLRNEAQAKVSEICPEPFAVDEFHGIIDEVAKSAGDLIVFLKYVRSVRVEEITGPNNATSVLLDVTTENPEEVRRQRDVINAAAVGDCREVLEKLRDNAELAPRVTYRHRLRITHRGATRLEEWQIATGLYVDDELEVLDAAETLLDYEGKALPWAGAAVRVTTKAGTLRVVPAEGRLFCFLPLPKPSKLPVHLNSFFDLGSSRDWLTEDTSNIGKDAERVRWNQALLRHCVPRAYAALIAALACRHGSSLATDPSSLYAIWPALQHLDGLMAEMGPRVFEQLVDEPVIRGTDGVWTTLEQLYVLPTGWEELQAPLAAAQLSIPDPPLHAHVRQGFVEAGVDLDELKPSILREKLRIDHDLNLPPIEADPWLQKREWLVTLLRFCLSDRPGEGLVGVPLALLDDGRLHTFGRSAAGLTFLAEDDEKAIFPDFKHWFVESAFALATQLDAIPATKLVRMKPDDVARNLKAILDPDGSGQDRTWMPDGPKLPHVEWLTDVIKYLVSKRAEISDVGIECLRTLPLIPDHKTHLCLPGTTETPLLAVSDLPKRDRLLKALDAFGVSWVNGHPALVTAMLDFGGAFRDHSLVCWLTGPDLVDSLAALRDTWEAKVTAYRPNVHDALLDLLADARWENHYDEAQLETLSTLTIFPTVDGKLAAARGVDVYRPTGFRPPSLGTDVHLLATGSSRWTPLLRRLKTRELDQATYITNVLLPRYSKFDRPQRLEALAWLQDNLTKVERELEDENSSRASQLHEAVVVAPLVECDDGILRAASETYHPHRSVIRDVLGDTVPYPDMTVYAASEERWLNFFTELGMPDGPQPQDLVDHIDDLCERSAVEGIDAVTPSLMSVFAHLRDNWEHYAASIVEDEADETRPLPTSLARRAWLPALRDEKRLRQFYGAIDADFRLYRPEELYPARVAHLLASQRPIAEFAELPRDFRDALGFATTVPVTVMLDHFDHVLDLFQSTAPTSEQDLKPFRKSVYGIYTELGRLCGTEQGLGDAGEDGDVDEDQLNGEGFYDVDALRTRYAGRECLWHESTKKLWMPERSYRSSVPFLRPFCEQLIIAKPERADLGLTALGRRGEPSAEDLIKFLQLYADEAEGNCLSEDQVSSVLRIYRRIGEFIETGTKVDAAALADAPLLTVQERLVGPELVLEEDTLRFEGKFAGGQFHLIHTHADPSFTQAMRVPKLSAAVEEHLLEEPVVLDDDGSAEMCRRLTVTLQTPGFRHGLLRLVQAQHGRGYRVQLGWLEQVAVVPVVSLRTLLTLKRRDGAVLEDTGEPELFVSTAGSGTTIYLGASLDQQHTYHLAHAVNQRLGTDGLRDLSHVVMILSVRPEHIDAALTRAHIPHAVEIAGNGMDATADDGAAMVYEEEDGTPESTASDNSGDAEDPRDDELDELPANHASDDDDNLKAETDDDSPSLSDDLLTDGENDEPNTDTEIETTGPGSGQRSAGTRTGSDDRQSVGSGTEHSAIVGDSNGSGHAGEDRGAGTADRTRSAGLPPSDRPPGVSGRRLAASEATRHHSPQRRNRRAVTYVVPEGQVKPEPDPRNDDQPENMRISQAAVQAVLKAEQEQRWRPVEKRHNNPGYDVESTSPDGRDKRYIEVKGIDGPWDDMGVPVSPKQFETASKLGEQFWLYVVEYAREPQRRKIFRIQNPADLITEFRFDSGWSQLAKQGTAPSARTTPSTKREKGTTEPRRGQRVRLRNGEVGEITAVITTLDHTTVTLRMIDGRFKPLLWRPGLEIVT